MSTLCHNTNLQRRPAGLSGRKASGLCSLCSSCPWQSHIWQTVTKNMSSTGERRKETHSNDAAQTWTVNDLVCVCAVFHLPTERRTEAAVERQKALSPHHVNSHPGHPHPHLLLRLKVHLEMTTWEGRSVRATATCTLAERRQNTRLLLSWALTPSKRDVQTKHRHRYSASMLNERESIQ